MRTKCVCTDHTVDAVDIRICPIILIRIKTWIPPIKASCQRKMVSWFWILLLYLWFIQTITLKLTLRQSAFRYQHELQMKRIQDQIVSNNVDRIINVLCSYHHIWERPSTLCANIFPYHNEANYQHHYDKVHHPWLKYVWFVPKKNFVS